jgi:flagellar hook-basal body complex protein FliE
MRINAYGAAAYAQTAQRLARPPAAAAEQPSPSSFGEVLRAEARTAAQGLQAGERIATQGLLGKAGVQEVVEAVNAAELGLQKVTAVRDRVIAAYQEIMRMPI